MVGVIQGSIKPVFFTAHKPPPGLVVKLGYILGLRVAPPYRRRGIGSSLVRRLEDWFLSNDVDYCCMATEKDNHASLNLFINNLRYFPFFSFSFKSTIMNWERARIEQSFLKW